MIQVRGDTWSVRSALKAIGGRWDPRERCWLFPNEAEEKVEVLLRQMGVPYSSRFIPDPE